MSGEHQDYGYSSEGVSCSDFYSLVIPTGIIVMPRVRGPQ